jgi:peptidoglycan/LPS O-acetylase OafA/YrhL
LFFRHRVRLAFPFPLRYVSLVYPRPTEEMHRGEPLPTTSRFPALDFLKAWAILVVVYIHAFQTWGSNQEGLIDRLQFVTRAAVPAFFFAAGFLQAASSEGALVPFLQKRLTRLLLPYFVASAFAWAFRATVWRRRTVVTRSCPTSC